MSLASAMISEENYPTALKPELKPSFRREKLRPDMSGGFHGRRCYLCLTNFFFQIRINISHLLDHIRSTLGALFRWDEAGNEGHPSWRGSSEGHHHRLYPVVLRTATRGILPQSRLANNSVPECPGVTADNAVLSLFFLTLIPTSRCVHGLYGR